jgi:photosystem II stability/assembly factor-like uncharacterized protein
MIAGSRGGAGLLLRSFDAGATWNSVRVEAPGHTPPSIAQITGNGPHLYALVPGKKVLRSDDGGSTWELVPDLRPEDPYFYPADLWAAGEDVFLVGRGCADLYEGLCFEDASVLVRSSDGLRTFVSRVYGYPWVDLNTSFIWGSGPNDLYVAVNWTMDHRETYGAVSRTTDGGHTWTGVYYSDFGALDEWGSVIQVTGYDARHVWLLVDEAGIGIGSSTDSGQSWNWVDIPAWEHNFRRIWAALPDEAYVLTDRAVLRVQGNRWSYQPIGLAGPYLDVSGTSERNVFITTGSGRVLHGTR